MEGHVARTPGLGLAQIFTACIAAAVGGRLPRCLAIEAMWRSSKGKSRSLSAGLPASMTRSRISPLLPVVRLSLYQDGQAGTFI
ncbi:hypothetical protein IE4872_PC00325 (plasmid) [Rhizobium gallicum]|uniref:Uncharacterized protein n=1 Tax=Rhizobium gallicum TaxID=56730 RepID=A0A1L5NR46_9HYPH|nr:hypothetical protein IE4872_PC00325 [Rhizobium gallicum]